MFYDKSIDIMKKNEGYKDEYSIWHEGTLISIKSIDVDVQPITKQIAFRDFGVDEDVKYRIFSDVINDLDINMIIKYNDKFYRVISILSWEDYIDFIVGDYHVS